MKDEEYQEYLIKAVERFGYKSQIVKTFEEMGELISAISKYENGLTDISNVIDEIIDVEFMIDQIRMIYNISDQEIESHRIKKFEKFKTIVDSDSEENFYCANILGF